MSFTSTETLKEIHSKGFLYEKLGTVQTFNDYANLLLPINFKTINSRFENTQYQVKATRGVCEAADTMFCNSQENKPNCSYSLTHNCKQLLSFIDKDMKKIQTVLGTFGTIANKREKRDTSTGGGQILKLIFGIPNSEDGDRFENVIKAMRSLSENQEKTIETLQKELKNFTLLLNTTYNHVLENAVKEINTNLKKGEKFIEKTQESENILESALKMNAYINRLSYQATDLFLESQSIINTILFAKKQTSHKSIITTKLYLDALKEHMQKVHENLSYPVEIAERNADILWSISSIQVIFDEELLFMEIRTPLVRKNIYNLTKVHSLPIVKADGTLATMPRVNRFYLQKNDEFIPMNSLDECKSINASSWVCLMNNVTTVKDTSNLCEIILMKEKESPVCKSEEIITSMFAVLPLEKNRWIIVSTEKDEEYESVCGDEIPENGTLKPGTYDLKLPDGCKFTINSKILRGLPASSTENAKTEYYIPEAEPSSLPNFQGFFEGKSLNIFHMEPIVFSKNDGLESWNELTESIESKKSEWNGVIIPTRDEGSTWQNVVSTFFIGLILLIICYFTWKFYCHKSGKELEVDENTERNINDFISAEKNKN